MQSATAAGRQRQQAQGSPRAAATHASPRPAAAGAPAWKLAMFHGMNADLLAGTAGIAICLIFLLSPSSPPTPVFIALGMVFTNAICPALLALAPSFYARHRTAVVLLARLSFMHGTLHVWQEERPWQRGAIGWPALLLTRAYSSRALVACWGALAWQLPLPVHTAVQALHVALAGWRLAPVVCSAGGALRGSPGKLQALALLLDWPLRTVGGPPVLMPVPGACLALAVWTQVTVAFILPTAVLLALQHRRQRGQRLAATSAASQVPPLPEACPVAPTAAASTPEPRGCRLRPPNPALLDSGDDVWSIPAVSCFAAQMLWLLLRVMMHDASA